MGNDEKKFIEKIFADYRLEFPTPSRTTITLANSMRGTLGDSLSGDKYLNELLQNADDAKATSVEFILIDNYLIFKHNGIHLNEEDINQGIADFQNPDRAKVARVDQIGNKGIGFKSIYNIASCATIISNKYQFRFDESYHQWKDNSKKYPWQIIPIWTEPSEMDSRALKFCDQESVHFIFKIRPTSLPKIQQHLEKLTSEYLLFLRTIKSIQLIINPSADANEKKYAGKLQEKEQVFKKDGDDFTIELIKTEENRAWYIYTKECSFPSALFNKIKTTEENSIPDKYKKMSRLPISIAILVDLKQQQLLPVESHPNIYCYLPTDIQCRIKFKANAELLLDVSRMNLRDSEMANAWNTFIFEQIYSEHVNFLSVLGLRAGLWSSNCNILSTPGIELGKFKEPCDRVFASAIISKLLVCNMTKKSLMKIQSTTIDTHKFIEKFGGDEQKVDIADPLVTVPTFPNVQPKQFDISRILAAITQPWFIYKIKTPEVNRDFLEFFADLYAQSSNKYILTQEFKKHALIISSKNELKKTIEVHLPNHALLYATTKFPFIYTIHPLLNASKKIVAFLKQMSVSELKLKNAITMANENPDNLVNFALCLSEQFSHFDDEDKKEIKQLKIKLSNNTFFSPTLAYLTDGFEPKINITPFLGTVNGLIIHSDYEKNVKPSSKEALKDFLLIAGVDQEIHLQNVYFVIVAINATSSHEQLMNFTRWLYINYYQQASPDDQLKWSAQIAGINLITSSLKTLPSSRCYVANDYNPPVLLQSNFPDLDYVSSDYIDENIPADEWLSFFAELGVKSSIKIKVHYDLTRDELCLLDPIAAKSYFEYAAMKYPKIWKSGESARHRISRYVQFDDISKIFAYQFFWKILFDSWDRYFACISDNKYSHYQYDSGTSIDSNIHYWVGVALKKHYGETSEVNNFYGNALKTYLAEYVGDLPIAEITGQLNEKQLSILGFKAVLPLNECKRILISIATANKATVDFQKIIYIYQMLLQNDSESFSNDYFKNVHLPNRNGEYIPVENLYYIPDDRQLFANNTSIIKIPQTINVYKFQKICQMLNVNIIQYNQLIPNLIAEQPSTFIDLINERLLYVIYLELHKQDGLGTENELTLTVAIFNTLKEKLSKLSLRCGSEIRITYLAVINDPVRIWLNQEENIVYHCPHSELDIKSQMSFFHYLYQYLGLKCSRDDFLEILTLPIESIQTTYASMIGTLTIESIISKAEKINTPEPLLTDDLLGESRLSGTKRKDPTPSEDNPDPEASNNSSKSATNPASRSSSRPGNWKWREVSATPSSTTAIASQPTVQPPSSLPKLKGGLFTERWTQEQRSKIGKAGELAVFNEMRKRHIKKHGAEKITDHSGGYTITKETGTKRITWLNAQSESGKPFDIEVVGEDMRGNKTRHIEVKTRTNKNEKFEVSYSTNEWDQMQQDATTTSTQHRLAIVNLKTDSNGALVTQGDDDTPEVDTILKKNLIDDVEKKVVKVTPFVRIAY